jgi:hypothetical protein
MISNIFFPVFIQSIYMNWKGIGIVAVAMAVIATVVHTVESILTMGYYTDPVYIAVWSKVMMPALGAPPPLSFFVLSILFALIGWGLFAFVYAKLSPALKESGPKKGLKFGALMFLVAGIPCTLMLYLMVNLPVGLLAIWTFSSLVLYLIGGLLSERLIG